MLPTELNGPIIVHTELQTSGRFVSKPDG